MISGALASASPQTFSSSSSSLVSKPKTSCYSYASASVSVARLSFLDLKLESFGLFGVKGSRRGSRVHCTTGPGEGDSKSVLDAFFLGRALAEALNERIESSVGEFLSTIGRLQAEQQKQVEEFQADVLDRAKKAKEKAAREAAEARGIVSKSTTENVTPVTVTNGVSPITPTTATTVDTPAVSQPSSSEPTPTIAENEPGPANEDTSLEVPIDD
ncbi:hypothetical protein RchiOBHm_Chr6g0285061 [Rosa chinensis]|uniref:Uncharacterized protein n=1 Tax=Rosa chinensis TaxID=74649 RepID=A0A2P6PUF3_ROSCH|nr:uncharacterized protein At4g13200, chloroplastic [Rosa chinensis]PRQ25567.1 hypothetical protein RchiOBHm_Chr6g0285061 [Rosa chinensis]